MKLIKLLLPIAAVCILLAVGEPLKPLKPPKPARLCTGQVAPLAYCPANFNGTANIIPSDGANSGVKFNDYVSAKCSLVKVSCEKQLIKLAMTCNDRDQALFPLVTADDYNNDIDLWQWRHLGLAKRHDPKGVILVYCVNETAAVKESSPFFALNPDAIKPVMLFEPVTETVNYERQFALSKKKMIRSSQPGLAMNGGNVLIATLIAVAGWLKGYSA